MSDDKYEGDHANQNEASESETDDVAALKVEIADLKDRLLRALAEVENTRRRAERDRP